MYERNQLYKFFLKDKIYYQGTVLDEDAISIKIRTVREEIVIISKSDISQARECKWGYIMGSTDYTLPTDNLNTSGVRLPNDVIAQPLPIPPRRHQRNTKLFVRLFDQFVIGDTYSLKIYDASSYNILKNRGNSTYVKFNAKSLVCYEQLELTYNKRFIMHVTESQWYRQLEFAIEVYESIHNLKTPIDFNKRFNIECKFKRVNKYKLSLEITRVEIPQ